MNIKMVEKKYYLITHPKLPGILLINNGDRKFILEEGRRTSYPSVSVHGDPDWEMTEENIRNGAECILEDIVHKRTKKKEEDKIAASSPKFEHKIAGVWVNWIKGFLAGLIVAFLLSCIFIYGIG